MSTAETAALIESVNELTNTVAGKVQEIDSAMEEAKASIPATILSESRKTLYVDQENGLDTNTGLSVSNPLKTLYAAANLTIPGGAVDIRLLRDYAFDPNDYMVNFYSAAVMVRSYDTANPVTIKFASYQAESTPDIYYMRSFQFFQSGSIEFSNINLELPEVPAEHAVGKSYPHGASVVRSNTSGAVVMPLSVRLSNVEIIVPDSDINEFHFIGNPSGITNFALANCVYPTDWRDRNKFFHQGRLSETLIGKRVVNSSAAISTDESVYNSGSVTE